MPKYCSGIWNKNDSIYSGYRWLGHDVGNSIHRCRRSTIGYLECHTNTKNELEVNPTQHIPLLSISGKELHLQTSWTQF